MHHTCSHSHAAVAQRIQGDAASLKEHAVYNAEQGQFEAAAELFEALLTSSQSVQPDVLEMQAQVLQELGQYEQAREAAACAVQLAPDWPDAHRTLARASLNCGSVKEAVASINTARMLDPADEDIALEAAEIADLHSQQLSVQTGLPLKLLPPAPAPAGASVSGPGSVVWDSGIALAWYLRHCVNQEALKNSTVLELGSGLGIGGLAAAMRGSHVTLTDKDDVVPALAANVSANSQAIAEAGGSAHAALLDWSCVSEGGSLCGFQVPEGLRWVLGADLVYNQSQVAPLLATLSCLFSSCGSDAQMLLAHKHRTSAVDEALFSGLSEAGLYADKVDAPEDGPWLSPDFKSIAIYSIARKPPASQLSAKSPQQTTTTTTTTSSQHPAEKPAAAGPPLHHSSTQSSREGAQHNTTEQHSRQQHSDPSIQGSPGPCCEQIEDPQAAEQQGPVYMPRNVALLGFGLPAVGKSTVLRALHASLANSIILDKDDINEALLGEHAMFSEYYDRHVRVQSYRVQLRLAASQFQPGKCTVALLDGQFGDKLNSNYILEGLRLLPVDVLPVYFTLPFAEQRKRMIGRGHERDLDKYDRMIELHNLWVAQHEEQIKLWDSSCEARGWKPVVRHDASVPVAEQVRRLLSLLHRQVVTYH